MVRPTFTNTIIWAQKRQERQIKVRKIILFATFGFAILLFFSVKNQNIYSKTEKLERHIISARNEKANTENHCRIKKREVLGIDSLQKIKTSIILYDAKRKFANVFYKQYPVFDRKKFRAQSARMLIDDVHINKKILPKSNKCSIIQPRDFVKRYCKGGMRL